MQLHTLHTGTYSLALLSPALAGCNLGHEGSRAATRKHDLQTREEEEQEEKPAILERPFLPWKGRKSNYKNYKLRNWSKNKESGENLKREVKK